MSDLEVYCDFDGTIATVDATDSLLASFARPEWEEVEAEWRKGDITARECMARQVALIDAGREDLERHIDGVAIDPWFSGFVADCEAMGIPVTVLSDGLDFAIGRILARHGLGGVRVRANHLHPIGERTYSFVAGAPRDTCPQGCCKCSVIDEGRSRAGRLIVFIGDGRSDFCASAKADLVLAKDALLDHCKSRGYPHLPFADFAEVRILLSDLVSSWPQTAAQLLPQVQRSRMPRPQTQR